MLSLVLRQILPPKVPFFVRQKVQISSKISPQIPNFANFVKFRQKSIFFVTAVSFRHFVSFSSQTKSFGAYPYAKRFFATVQTWSQAETYLFIDEGYEAVAFWL